MQQLIGRWKNFAQLKSIIGRRKSFVQLESIIEIEFLSCLSFVSRPHITAVTRDLGIRLNLKMVLYLENLCIMEKIRIFNPKPLVAPGRYMRAKKSEITQENCSLKKHLFPQKNSKTDVLKLDFYLFET